MPSDNCSHLVLRLELGVAGQRALAQQRHHLLVSTTHLGIDNSRLKSTDEFIYRRGGKEILTPWGVFMS